MEPSRQVRDVFGRVKVVQGIEGLDKRLQTDMQAGLKWVGGRIPAGEYQVLYVTRETEQLVLFCMCLETLKMVSKDFHTKGVGGGGA